MLADAQKITEMLVPDTCWGQVRVLPTTGSTNADLTRLAREGEAPGAVLVALEQTSGRGRMQRSWASPPGASVAMSVLLRPVPAFEQWGWLSLLAGMAVADGVDDLALPGAGRVSLKWPNDVLIDGRKVCGILSERVDRPDGPSAVVGMGINVSLTDEQLPVPGATSLGLAGFDTDQNRLVAGVLNRFARLYARWQERGDLTDDYAPRCSSIGAALTVQLPGGDVTGTGVGVDEYGHLIVQTTHGRRVFPVGDVIHARLGGVPH